MKKKICIIISGFIFMFQSTLCVVAEEDFADFTTTFIQERENDFAEETYAGTAQHEAEEFADELDISIIDEVKTLDESKFQEEDFLTDEGIEAGFSDGEELEEEILEEYSFTENGMDAEELFEAYAQNVLYGDLYGISLLSSYNNADKLNGITKELYELNKNEILRVANGERTDTVFSFDLTGEQLEMLKIRTTEVPDIAFTTIKADGKKALSEEGKQALREKVSKIVNNGLIMRTLVTDFPYEMYWFDKTIGSSVGYTVAYTTEKDGTGVLYVKQALRFTYNVAAEYKDMTSEYAPYAVSGFDTERLFAAKTNAKKIVEKYAQLNDYERLDHYRGEICSLTEYENNCMSYEYGNVWQLINVFDGDPDTNVVCEGYAKAFQYLCDLSSFKREITCYTVYGYLGWKSADNAHMWNIVNMWDGSRYLVDITNCDTDSGEGSRDLFMTGAKIYRNDENGMPVYQLRNAKGYMAVYLYDDDSYMLYTSDELTLSTKPYAYEVSDELAKIISAKLGLTDKVSMKFMIKLDEKVAQDDYLQIFNKGEEKRIYVSETKKEYSTVLMEECDVFEVPLYAKEMGRELKIRMMINGEPGTVQEYSIKTYADSILTKYNGQEEYTALCDLIRSMLNYGSYAQKYFGEMGDTACGTGLFADGQNPVEIEETEQQIKENLKTYRTGYMGRVSGLKLSSASLVLDSDIDARVYFELDEGKKAEDYVFTVEGTEKEICFGEKEGKHYVYIPHISVDHFHDSYRLTISSKEEPNERLILNFGAFQYARMVIETNRDLKLKHMVKAMYLYNQAARAYIAA